MSSKMKKNKKKSHKVITPAELKFKEIASLKGLNLRFHCKVLPKSSDDRVRNYIADFYDERFGIIFEVDGGFHFTEEQKRKDNYNTYNLRQLGYKIFRISYEDVFSGKTTGFLINAYKSIGINI